MDEHRSNDEIHPSNQPTVRLLEPEHIPDLSSNSMLITSLQTHTVDLETFSTEIHEDCNSGKRRFRKAIVFSQDEKQEGDLGGDSKTCISREEFVCTKNESLTSQSAAASESYEEVFLTQSLSDQRFYGVEDNASQESQKDSYSVNRMLSELIASQAIWSTQQQQQHVERRVPNQQITEQSGMVFIRKDDGVDDGVVPQLGNELRLQNTDSNEKGKWF